MPTYYIIGAGEFTLRDLWPTDFIIAADGSLHALETPSIRPDLLIGDLDSLGDHHHRQGFRTPSARHRRRPLTRTCSASCA